MSNLVVEISNKSVASPICGDSIVVLGESCDDGTTNDAEQEGCLLDCSGSFEGWTCENGTTTTISECFTTCGDKYIRGIEQCEDWNSVDGDGCDQFCMIESGWKQTINLISS